ncbi:unnamed protein product [Closterium sp. NIES-54]
MGPDEWIEAPAQATRWGESEISPWDETAVGAKDDVGTKDDVGAEDEVGAEDAVGAKDDDGVKYWSRGGLHEKLPIPSLPLPNRKCPNPFLEECDARSLGTSRRKESVMLISPEKSFGGSCAWRLQLR